MIKTDIEKRIEIERESIRELKAQLSYFEKQMLISSGRLEMLLEIQEKKKADKKETEGEKSESHKN